MLNLGGGSVHLEAMMPILLASTQYQPGDTLPATNTALVEAWIETGAAAWVEEKTNKKPPKARPAVAQPGLPGKATGGETGEDVQLVGRIPKTKTRKKKAE